MCIYIYIYIDLSIFLSLSLYIYIYIYICNTVNEPPAASGDLLVSQNTFCSALPRSTGRLLLCSIAVVNIYIYIYIYIYVYTYSIL